MSDHEQLVGLLRQVARLRAFEERVARDFREGMIPGIVHLGLGQEAVAAGVSMALTGDDQVVSNHRGHCHVLAKGAPMDRLMAEIWGRVDGVCGGLGGSMHLADVASGNLGANGIVGAGLPIAVGAALGLQILGSDAIAVAYFGDGAISTGAFHEGAVIASLDGLPLLLVAENNGYSETTGADYHLKGQTVAARLAGYGFPTVHVDGMDALAVYEAASGCVDRVRRTRSPMLLEARTYRFHGHYEGEFAEYRTADEIEQARRRDPVSVMSQRCIDAGVPAETVERTVQEATAEADRAADFAAASPEPVPHQIAEGV